MISFFKDCKKIWDKYTEDEMTVHAAHASFFIVIAVFPFLMVMLSLIQFIPSVNKSDLLSILVRIMPDMLDSLVIGIVNDLYTKSPATILSVSAMAALWSAARGMMAIERGLNKIYDDNEHRNYIIRRIVCAFYTLIFMLVCVFSLVLLVFGTSLQNMVLRAFPVFASFTIHLISFRTILAMTLFFVCFLWLYTVAPKRKQDPKKQIPGSIFTTICWLGFSYLFSLYFTNFSNYSYMYGSLTAIVLLMLWLYFCICIFFIGAEINYYVEFKGSAAQSSE